MVEERYLLATPAAGVDAVGGQSHPAAKGQSRMTGSFSISEAEISLDDSSELKLFELLEVVRSALGANRQGQRMWLEGRSLVPLTHACLTLEKRDA